MSDEAGPAPKRGRVTPSGGERLEGAGRSDTGLVRARNEDALLVRPDVGLLVVADGMGGAPAGDVASALAVEAMDETLGSPPSGESGEEEAPADRMARALEAAHQRILREQRERPDRQGMGTTLTALHFDPAGRHVTVGHVGDSRAYRFRGGRLELLTRDHTWVQEEVEKGRLSSGAARSHPGRHMLTRVLGVGIGGPVEVRELPLEGGDLFLLCTDGLPATLEEDAIAGFLQGADDVATAVDELVSAAHRKGSPDNVTVVLGRWREGS